MMAKRAKKATMGMRIAEKWIVNSVGGKPGNPILARRIDAVVRREARNAFEAGRRFEKCTFKDKCLACELLAANLPMNNQGGRAVHFA